MEKKQMITFKELLAYMPTEITGANPSSKYLKENDTPVLISADRRAIVYKSGYVYYRAASREVVLNILECGEFIYESGKWRYPENVKKEDILSMDWYTVIVLKGEEQAALNLENLENDHKHKDNLGVIMDEFPDIYNLEESLLNKLYLQKFFNLLSEKEKDILILCKIKGYTLGLLTWFIKRLQF